MICRILPALLVLFVVDAARAQLRGTVVDASGQPVADATVDVWAGPDRIGGAQTNAAGAFLVQRTPRVPTSLSVRRIGMRTRIVDLASADTAVTVRMEVASVVLAPIRATGTRRLCPNREDPAARALWTRMRGHYWQGADSLDLFGLAEHQSGAVPRAQIEAADFAPRHPQWVYATDMSESHVAALENLGRRGGYGARAMGNGGGGGERTAFWHYPSLDGVEMQHWTRDSFAARHTLAIVSTGPEQTVISFCPRERMGEFGQVQGTLAIHADGTLASARWAFRTPAPDEDAGGEAIYLPPYPALSRVLIPSSTRFWRKTTLNRYYVEHTEFIGWRRLNGFFDPHHPTVTPPRPVAPE
ncbi:MAG TPA: carboxypeptidase-like regulatory domain-containing protein [Longimicrobium sp.]|uniref:carboxypeptidase-like regulatory domain-containing protein n=1 Tax=Longimicrobium sp. TaxID=2029185 RepID=UPI002ED9AD8E